MAESNTPKAPKAAEPDASKMTKAELLDALEKLQAQVPTINPESNVSEEDLEKVKKNAERKRKTTRKVPLPKPKGQMIVLEEMSWKLKDLRERLKGTNLPKYEVEYKRLIVKLERRFIDAFQKTEVIDKNTAEPFRKEFDLYCKQNQR